MAEAAKLRGKVPFPEAGEGVYLQFKASDLEALQAHFEKDAPDSWTWAAIMALEHYDVRATLFVFSRAAKRETGAGPVTLDDVELAFGEVAIRLLDALCFGLHGKSYEEWAKEAVEKINAAKEAAEAPESPPKARGRISSGSGPRRSGRG